MQHNKYVDFTELYFLGPQNKSHGVCGLGKHYHMNFNNKIGHGTYEIHYITYFCPMCTYTIEQPWTPSIT